MGKVFSDLSVSADGFATGIDAIVDSGATIMGRNMFGDRDISVAGGARTVNQFLAEGLIDELRLHVTACVLGAGERVFDGVPPQRLERASVRATSLVTHITYLPVR